MDNLKLNSTNHSYNTRNRNNVYLNKNKYSIIKNSFDSVSRKLFNSLPELIKDLTLERFKLKIRCTLLTNPLYKIDEFYDITWT